MVEISGITKQYRNGYVANQEITLSVESGEVYGLLGPNGAGKTTLVNQLIGLAKPTSGTIHVDGVDVVENCAAARELCSFMPQTQIPIEGLTPLQAIEMIARLRGMPRTEARRRAEEMITSLHLEPWASKPGEHLSGGVRRLVAFCMTCAAAARVVVLDEPTNDVDPERRRLLWRVVRQLAEAGRAVILVTHNVLEAERSADKLAIIHESKLIREGTPASFRDNAAGRMILELSLEPGIDRSAVTGLDDTAVQTGRRLFCPVSVNEVGDRVKWANGLRESRIIEEFSINPPSLEEAYLQIVGAKGQEEDK